MKPVQYDFLKYLPWSVNITDNLVAPHVEDAFKFDIRPKLETLAIDLYALPNDGSKPELYTFYNDYVCQWWTLLAFRRFIQVHGRNLTQFGYTKTRDPEGTFEQLTQEERAVIMKQLQNDANMLYTYMLQQTWKFDNVTYRKTGDTDCGPNRNNDFGIGALT